MAKDFEAWTSAELTGWMNEIRANPPKRAFEAGPQDKPAMTAGDLTHGEDKGHTARLLRALGHDPKDAR